jgi:hypothetical protein
MGWKKGQEVQLVPLSEASGRVLEVYRDMQHIVGVPHISSFFQYLGSNPRFLDRFWTTVRPVVQSEAFFSCSSRLRADAYSRVHSYFAVPNIKTEVDQQQFSIGACEELKDCINFFSCSIPMSLLLASLLNEAFAGPVGSSAIQTTPAPPPKPHRRIVLVDEDTSGPVVKAIFADIRTTTGADVIHTVYRAFARWPDFLQAYWSKIKPITTSELFQQTASSVREDALQITAELPGPFEFNASTLTEVGMNHVEASSLSHTTDMFVHSLAAALLNVSFARIAMEGGSLGTNNAEEMAPVPVPTTQLL